MSDDLTVSAGGLMAAARQVREMTSRLADVADGLPAEMTEERAALVRLSGEGLDVWQAIHDQITAGLERRAAT